VPLVPGNPTLPWIIEENIIHSSGRIIRSGSFGLTHRQEGQATWLIAAYLLHPVLTWFAQHPDAELTELDREIAALPVMPWPPEGGNVAGTTGP
jgi:hypothetical protein